LVADHLLYLTVKLRETTPPHTTPREGDTVTVDYRDHFQPERQQWLKDDDKGVIRLARVNGLVLNTQG
jgi:hypothetical protein